MNETELSTSTKPAKTKKRFSVFKMFVGLLFIALVSGLAVTGYLYYQTKQEIRYLTTEAGQQELAKREIEAVVSRLGKLTILPTEEPVIATILDPEYLATQSAFYQNSFKGDKLVVYSQAQKAYIYSPKRHIIVNAGPLVVEPENKAALGKDDSIETTENITVEIRNGTAQPGAGNQLAQQLDNSIYEVTRLSNAARQDYTQSQIVILDSQVSQNQISQLIESSQGQIVTTLPEGEAISTAQVVVIIGANQGQTEN